MLMSIISAPEMSSARLAPSAMASGSWPKICAETGRAALRHVQQRGGLPVIIAQSLGADHLGVHQRRALLETERRGRPSP